MTQHHRQTIPVPRNLLSSLRQASACGRHLCLHFGTSSGEVTMTKSEVMGRDPARDFFF
jgi:hypothetical protein